MLHLTFGAHEGGLGGLAPVPTALVEGQTLLARPCDHLRIVRQQTGGRQRTHAVNTPRVGVGDEQRPCHRVNRQEVLVGGVVAKGEGGKGKS